jgi:hypothetical protein
MSKLVHGRLRDRSQSTNCDSITKNSKTELTYYVLLKHYKDRNRVYSNN